MSEYKLSTEREVLDKIGAKDFRSISKNQIMEFASQLPYMDKEVAIKCIDQFPEFRKNVNDVIEQLNHTCDSIIADNKDSRDKAIESYQIILNELSNELKTRKFMTFKHRREITNKMVEIADKINEIHIKDQQQNFDILKIFGAIAGVALMIGGAILGVNIKKGD